MRIKKLIRDIFGFSSQEINGFLILLPLMAAFIFAMPLYRFWFSGKAPNLSSDIRKLDSLLQHWTTPAKEVERHTDGLPEKVRPELFFFNPNTIRVKEMRKLGFSENLSTRIANYRQKGGQFRTKADLLKIYGLDSAFYFQIYPYIRLPETHEEARADTGNQEDQPHKSDTVFDLNKADTAQFKTVYGIGSVLAARIVRYRERLGGFINTEQLYEVYGLDSAVADRLRKVSYIDNRFKPHQININTADEKELSNHPYIRKSVAKSIVSYRYQHGPFNDIKDLYALHLLMPEEARKMIPYLKVE